MADWLFSIAKEAYDWLARIDIEDPGGTDQQQLTLHNVQVEATRPKFGTACISNRNSD